MASSGGSTQLQTSKKLLPDPSCALCGFLSAWLKSATVQPLKIVANGHSTLGDLPMALISCMKTFHQELRNFS